MIASYRHVPDGRDHAFRDTDLADQGLTVMHTLCELSVPADVLDPPKTGSWCTSCLVQVGLLMETGTTPTRDGQVLWLGGAD